MSRIDAGYKFELIFPGAGEGEGAGAGTYQEHVQEQKPD